MRIAEDRKALVTGGASGIGRAIAGSLYDAGARVAVVDIDDGRIADTVRQLGHGAIGVRADVRSRDEVHSAVDQAVAAFGGLDTLVVSAGIFEFDAFEEVSEESWDRTLDVNLKGAFLALQAAMPHLKASGRGRAVLISSDAGKRGFSGIAAYTASKFGMNGLMESVAAEVAKDNVTVNSLCPVGCPTTGMGQVVLAGKVERTGEAPETIMARAAATNPLGRNVHESDVADAALFLVSEHASFLTGVALDIDGGASLGVNPGTGE